LNLEYHSFMNFSTYINNILGNILKPVVDSIFPPVCFLCDSFLENNRKIVCNSCWSNQKSLTDKQIQEIKKVIIKNNYGDIYMLFDFTEDFQKIIHLLKYERCLTLGYYFASELVSKFKESFFLKYDIIIPVPLHPIKYRERGYNQSFEIIKHLPGNKSKDTLRRKKQTQSQTKLSREERIQNVSQAFECKSRLDSTKILLFDDIITTGSTLNECGNELLKCGASKVDILCLAAPLKHAL
jgi:competence protein ComFC